MSTSTPQSTLYAPSTTSTNFSSTNILTSQTTTSSSNLPSSNTFTFPREHSFPPFYTPQPNSSTHHAQLQKWSTLIQSFCRHHRIFRLSPIAYIDSPLFYNRTIGKRLGTNEIKEVIEFMRKEGRADWVAGKEGEAWIYWKTVEEWASTIAEWVDGTAQKNTVLTLYELTESEATLSQEFHGMDADLLQKALAVLVKRGKAQVFGQDDGLGVKFF
ncbi:putative ESCRT-II complex component [Halenospora varia]|nr:putative ESCRT-II complex component [Halenospora varia]